MNKELFEKIKDAINYIEEDIECCANCMYVRFGKEQLFCAIVEKLDLFPVSSHGYCHKYTKLLNIQNDQDLAKIGDDSYLRKIYESDLKPKWHKPEIKETGDPFKDLFGEE